jgi:hypothetical protein
MAVLVNLPFAQTFSFSRGVAAPYRNAGGVTVTAPRDIARFDHDADGNRLGLLISSGTGMEDHDQAQVLAGDWEPGGADRRATVFVEWDDGTAIQRRALYTQDVRATVDACLHIEGHLRVLGACPGHLANRGGSVRYKTVDWPLGDALSAGDGFALGDDVGRVLIGSH